jgi:uncharacterized membrane protein YphA (DoxX/SURF4 family)
MATRQAPPPQSGAGKPAHASAASASPAVPRAISALVRRGRGIRPYAPTAIAAVALGPYPTLVSRLVLGLIFLLTGVGKAADPAGFMRDIRAYQMLPGALVTAMAYGLPWLEILLAVYLLAGLYLRWAAAITGALLVVFMVAMGQALARGLTLDCGCFGAGLGGVALREEVSIGSILRDAVLLALAVHLILVPSRWTVDQRLRGRIRRSAQTASAAMPRPSAVSAPAPIAPAPITRDGTGTAMQTPRTPHSAAAARSMRTNGRRRRR